MAIGGALHSHVVFHQRADRTPAAAVVGAEERAPPTGRLIDGVDREDPSQHGPRAEKDQQQVHAAAKFGTAVGGWFGHGRGVRSEIE